LNGKELVQDSKEKLAKGDKSGVLTLIQALAFSKINGKALSDYRPIGIWNERLGVEPISLEDDVKQLLARI
jgi:hypothetical protein